MVPHVHETRNDRHFRMGVCGPSHSLPVVHFPMQLLFHATPVKVSPVVSCLLRCTLVVQESSKETLWIAPQITNIFYFSFLIFFFFLIYIYIYI